MYRTPIKSKNQNNTSMVKAMGPFRDSQTPLLSSPGPGSMYRLNLLSKALHENTSIMKRSSRPFSTLNYNYDFHFYLNSI